MVRPKMGRPKIHKKGTGTISLYLTKAEAARFRRLAEEEGLQLNRFAIKLMDHYETCEEEGVSDILKKISRDLDSIIKKEESS